MRLTSSLFILTLLTAANSHAAPPANPSALPDLPEAISSFGAAVADGSLYVYGGHIGDAHDHSAENLSSHFARLDLRAKSGSQWEALPIRDRVQGLAMVEWKGRLIRVGGVTARNKPREKTDMHSTAVVESFDPATKTWTSLTPLPEPRSSFDAVVFRDHLYIIGGWNLAGDENSGDWAARNYVADLSQSPLKWEALPEAPFHRRALAVAATTKRIYAIGGLTKEGKPSNEVHVYDPERREWSDGPAFPAEGRHAAFGISAFGIGNSVWASAADGKVRALHEGTSEWRDSGHALATARFFHRLLPGQDGRLLFIAGAGRGGHRADIEAIDLPPLEKKIAHQPAATWPEFRRDGSNRPAAHHLPLKWSDATTPAWTAELAGYGQSSPVVAKNLVFTTTIDGDSRDTLRISAFDVASGKQQWQQTFPASQTWPVTDYVTKASPSPAVDENGLYTFFETGDLIALDHTGNTLWKRSLVKDYGAFEGNHGVGTSLVQTKDSLVLAIEHGGPSYLISIDKRDGKTLWKSDHPSRVAWSTPLLTDGKLILSASGSVECYDAASGSQLWKMDGFSGNNVPSPTRAGNRVFIASGDRDNCAALTLDGKVAWRAPEATASFASPVVAGNCVYFVSKAGIVYCHAADTGALRWTHRLPDSCWATPVPTENGVYFFSKNGATTVLKDTPNGPEQVAESKLNISGRVYAVAAIEGAWIIRTGDRLVCLR